MRIIEHLDGRSPADDYVLRLLERWGLLDLAALRAWLQERRRSGPVEVPVVVETSEVETLMQPTGPRGGRLPR